MAKTINTVLKLKDQFSSGIKTCTKSTKGLTAETKICEKRAKNLANSMKKDVVTGAKMAASALLATGAAGAAAAKKMAESTANTLDTIDKASQKMGISAESYQRWDYALARCGANVSVLKNGVKTLTNQMDEAKDGGEEAAGAFKKLGVSYKNVDGSLRSQEATMKDTLMALSEVKNKTERAKLATQLFGKAGTELAPLFNQGSKGIQELLDRADELGLVIDGKTVKSGAKLKDTMDDVKDSFSRAATSIGAELIPYFQKGSEWMLSKLPAIRKGAVRVAGGFEKLAKGVGVLKDNSDVIIPVLAAVVSGITAFKVINTVRAIMDTWRNTMLAFNAIAGVTNTTLLACPLTWIVIGIMAVVAATTLIIRKFGSFKNAIDALMNKFPALKSAFNGIKAVINTLASPIKTVISGLKRIFSFDGKSVNITQNTTKTTVKGHANGTPYFAGGLTRVNEGGRGEMITLPSGSRILPADKTDKLVSSSGRSINVYLTIQGNVIGNEEYMEQTGNYIAKKVIEAMDNA